MPRKQRSVPLTLVSGGVLRPGARVDVFHDPLTCREREARVTVVKHLGYVGTEDGRELHSYEVDVPGIGRTERNILQPMPLDRKAVL